MAANLPQAIIFDMDDTILSDDQAAEKCWRQVCNDFAPRLDGPAAGLLSAIRDIRRWYWADPERSRLGGQNLSKARLEILAMAFARQNLEQEQLAEEMSVAYQRLKHGVVEWMPGALDTLRGLRDAGVRLGLITNGDADGQRAKVTGAGLESLFQSILIEGEFGVGKPDQQVFHHTLERLGVRPGEAWMVGDNLYADIGGAQAVGIYGVWVDWRGNGPPPLSPAVPDRTIRSVTELAPGGGE